MWSCGGTAWQMPLMKQNRRWFNVLLPRRKQRSIRIPRASPAMVPLTTDVKRMPSNWWCDCWCATCDKNMEMIHEEPWMPNATVREPVSRHSMQTLYISQTAWSGAGAKAILQAFSAKRSRRWASQGKFEIWLSGSQICSSNLYASWDGLGFQMIWYLVSPCSVQVKGLLSFHQIFDGIWQNVLSCSKAGCQSSHFFVAKLWYACSQY